jgi:hypothetical protein
MPTCMFSPPYPDGLYEDVEGLCQHRALGTLLSILKRAQYEDEDRQA